MSKTAESKVFSTREEWLVEFVAAINPVIKDRTGLSPRSVKVSCGWPSKGGTRAKNQRIGECWGGCDGDRSPEIFISPTLETDDVASTLVHELLHAYLPKGSGHRKPFSQAARKVGLDGENSKPTATVPSEAFQALLKDLTDKLGPYPHQKLETPGPKEKGRNLKFQCPGCGYIGRTSAFWLETVGPPYCRDCQMDMVTEEELVEDFVKLVAVESIQELRIPGDERFRIRMARVEGRRDASWFILDHEPECSTEGAYSPLRLLNGVLFEDLDIEAHATVRLTPAESRQDAIDLIEALREGMAGLTTYQTLDEDQDELAQQDAEWLDDSEDEVPDYEDGSLDPEAEAACADETARREAWVVAKG
jgi:hypothetical protein